MLREYWLVEKKASHKAWKVHGTYKSADSAIQHRDRTRRFDERWAKFDVPRRGPYQYRIVHVQAIAVIQ